MAIGLSNVNNRKAKRTTTAKSVETSTKSKTSLEAAEPVELKSAESKVSTDAWSTRGLAREGRSARRERGGLSGDINPTWLEWTSCVTGGESPNRLLQVIQKVLDLEMFIFEFLVYDLDIPEKTKKRIFEIRSRGARALEIRKLLLPSL